MIEGFANRTTTLRVACDARCYRPAVAGTVRLLTFAGARDIVGSPEVSVDLDVPCSAADFLSLLCERYPGLVPYRRALRIAVNGSYVAWHDPVSAGDEVALIPPVAGG